MIVIKINDEILICEVESLVFCLSYLQRFIVLGNIVYVQWFFNDIFVSILSFFKIWCYFELFID